MNESRESCRRRLPADLLEVAIELYCQEEVEEGIETPKRAIEVITAQAHPDQGRRTARAEAAGCIGTCYWTSRKVFDRAFGSLLGSLLGSVGLQDRFGCSSKIAACGCRISRTYFRDIARFRALLRISNFKPLGEHVRHLGWICFQILLLCCGTWKGDNVFGCCCASPRRLQPR